MEDSDSEPSSKQKTWLDAEDFEINSTLVEYKQDSQV
jgi:hypothetical protein